MARNLCRGRSRIENDGLAWPYQFCRGLSDSDFFIPVQGFFGAERVILSGLHAPHGAAVRSHRRAGRSESVEVVADSDGRNGATSDHIHDSYLAVLFDEVQHT